MRRPQTRSLQAAATVGIAALALTACAIPRSDADFGVTRVEVSENLVLEDATLDTDLAPGLQALAKLDLGGIPMASAEAVIGLAEADEANALSMAAISSEATASWQIATSPTCTAYVVTEADGVDIAVFLDSRVGAGESGQLTETVATAFRIDNGEPLWGPVPVPGPPLADAGLVFYAMQDAPIADVSSATVMLDPATGEPRFSAAEDDVVIIGEFNGIGLIDQLDGPDQSLQAVRLSDREVLWSEADLQRPDGVSRETRFSTNGMREAALAGVLVGTWVGDGTDREQFAAYSLADGSLISEHKGELLAGSVAGDDTVYVVSRSDVVGEPDAAQGDSGEVSGEPGSSTHSVIALSLTGGVLWEAEVPAGASLTAAGDGFVYLRLGGTGLALDASTGDILAEGDFRVPEHVFADGTLLISTAGDLWLARRG